MRQGCLDASIASGHLDMHRGIEACIKVCVEASSRFSVEASRPGLRLLYPGFTTACPSRHAFRKAQILKITMYLKKETRIHQDTCRIVTPHQRGEHEIHDDLGPTPPLTDAHVIGWPCTGLRKEIANFAPA